MAGQFPIDADALLKVLNHLNVGVYVTDRDRRIMLWNRKAAEITGWRAMDVVGRRCRDNVLCHVDKEGRLLCPTHLCPLYRAMEVGKESVTPILVFAKKADGRRVALSVSVAPLRNDGGEVIGGIEVFRDETETVHDLEFARTIQRNLLPKKLPEAGEIEFDARYYPHDLLGGDFYDVRAAGEGRYGFLVADVRGHGVSASLYTMVLKSLLEGKGGLAGEPAALVTAVNRELSALVVSESFATAAYGVVDARNGEVVYSNAGHPPFLHYQARRGLAAELESHGLPLGVDAGEQYAASRVTLEPGDALLLYTDGITEITDKAGKALGAKGLAELFEAQMKMPAANRLEGLYNAALEHCGEVAFSDDVLLVSVARTGAKK